MRSRFSAFAVGDAAYLLATWHPSTRPATLDLTGNPEWRQLEIRGTTAGSLDDTAGTVEFVAQYWDPTGHQFGELRENSAFVRQAGEWFYVGPTS